MLTVACGVQRSRGWPSGTMQTALQMMGVVAVATTGVTRCASCVESADVVTHGQRRAGLECEHESLELP